MSFILDALRKSERERQQKAAPGIGDVSLRPPAKTSNRWVIVVVAVLAINAVLVTGLLLRDSESPPDSRTVQPASLPRNVPAPARRPALTAPQREDVRPLAEEVPDESQSSPPAVATMARTDPPVAAVPSPALPAAAPSRQAPAPSSSPGVPTMEELVLDGSLEMNPLRLDIHVFSEQPGQRFVFINMTKYREGESIKEGPQVETITTDGVVLSHQGSRFLLTR